MYHFSENSPFAEQAGLSLDTTGLVTPNQYSLEIIFAFDSNASPNGYRRLVDTHERATDNGLHVIPTNNLQVSGFAPVRPAFNPSEFHHLVVTNISGSNVVSIFLDGAPVITTTSNVLDISNAAHVLNFFLDDSFEYSSGQIGLVRLYDSVLGNSEVAAIALNPLPAPVPLPTTMWLLGAAVGGLGLKSRRNNLGHSYPK